MIDGAKMRSLRKALKMSQLEFGEAIGVDQTMVSKMETGICDITTGRLIAIAQVLEVPPSELLASNPPHPQTRKQRGGGGADSCDWLMLYR